MAQPEQKKKRGPVQIVGVTTRTNTSKRRRCLACGEKMYLGQRYERVARMEGVIESYSEECFVQEFGERRLYGE